MRVLIKSMRNQPLMPCKPQKARMLLKQNKAKIISYKPFTIQLLYPTGESIQEIHIGIDEGAYYIGVAITSQNNILLKGEIELRHHTNIQKSISELLTLRKILRKNRRARKTRYRKSRFLNRKKRHKWLPPSLQSRINAIFFWIDKFLRLLPNPILHIEVGLFHIPTLYQNYHNMKYFIFTRDDFTCQVCKTKNAPHLQLHHIQYKSKGGTDKIDNLITICSKCHTYTNHQPGGILWKWMTKNKTCNSYKEPTFMNILYKRTIQHYPNAIITYGYKTLMARKNLSLPKTHYNDAIAISGITNIKQNITCYFYIKQFRKKKRSLHEAIPCKGRSSKGIYHPNINQKRRQKNKKKLLGWYKNDYVKINNHTGWIYGFSGSHSAIVRDIHEKHIQLSKKTYNHIQLSKLKLICHNNNWQFKILKD